MVQTFFSILLASLAMASGDDQQNGGIKVDIRIQSFKNDKGMCRLLVFERKKGFPDSKEHAARMLSSSIRNKSAEFSLELKPGRYAVSVIHDENSNGKMDKTWYGKPLEGFGSLNNPKIGSGPPGFEESSAHFDEKSNHFIIKLNYL